MMREKPLAGQAALVTGANSGIGEAVARCFADAGAKVAINWITHEDATNTIVDDIKKKGGQAIGVKADVSNEGEVQAMFAETIRAFGTVDILCANAGLQDDAPFTEMTLQKWNHVIGVNLTGQFL
jgi:glucose 1-dehydrogenase